MKEKIRLHSKPGRKARIGSRFNFSTFLMFVNAIRALRPGLKRGDLIFDLHRNLFVHIV